MESGRGEGAADEAVLNKVLKQTIKTDWTLCGMEDVGMKTMSALESQGENIERWEEVVDGINQVRSPHEHIFIAQNNRKF